MLGSLTIGLTAYILITSRVFYRRSYDTHFPHYESIYRVVTSTYTNGSLTIRQPRTQRNLGEAMEELYP